ncbi:clock-controlled pheromone ccg-4 precursor [Trichoderma arundinaceum]|uniref:Clock-controlled pheromone ccg-4 n=1 Tax=Trichoderma arundinaceum TaxID=490622 RepID=A0A395NL09_TRIAR|nr:clock-controlled pheromone ccg-4 precursor [Trichoderma arundinaceum]
MKFLTTVTLFATAALAAPNPEPWCYRIGEPCWKVKRTTEAFVGAVRSTGGLVARSEPVDGIPTEIAGQALQGLNDLANLIAYNAEDPKVFLGDFVDEHKETEKRDVQEDKRWCYRIGEPCWKAKRTDEIQEDKRWCYRIGQPCWKAKRAAEAVLDASVEGDEKRSVEEVSPEKRWCYRIGQPCWKAKRDLESVQDLARSVIESMQ